MKILFFITVLSHGRGGHFHTLNHISKELGRKNEILIITIGPGFSSIIGENPYFFNHYKLEGINFHKLYKEIDKAIASFKPDIIHFFDSLSYNVLRLHISSKNYKIILSKCGGPNIKWPFVNNLIVFSQENYDWYKNIPKFRSANIYLIPNRVKQLEVNESYKPLFKDPGSFNFVRICRIGATHKKSIEDSINLVKYLHKKGHFNVKLYIIGNIEKINVYNEFIKGIADLEDTVSFITSTDLTKEASRMLYLADAVIGTGRGFMESASLGKPLLVINAEDNYPVLINQNNFSDAFRTNFSQRNIFESYNLDDNFSNIERMIIDKEYYSQLSIFSKSIFQKYFSLDKVFNAYTEVNENAKFGENRYLQDIIMILKDFYQFSVSSFKRNKIGQ